MMFAIENEISTNNENTLSTFSDLIGTDDNDTLEGTEANDIIEGNAGRDILIGFAGSDLITGGAGNDVLFGGGSTRRSSDEILFDVGGSDTLQGGIGDDGYAVFLDSSGGSIIEDSEGESDELFIFARNTDIEGFTFATAPLDDPATYGDSAITLATPQAGIVGLARSGTDLIIDINRDGVAEGENDLTIVDYFDEEGNLGTGAIEFINNIDDGQQIVDFFADNSDSVTTDEEGERDVYRFFNNGTGVHFYTADENERDAVLELDNFNFEGASYRSVDPLSGDSTPVYRFLNQDTGVHLYTISELERESVANLDNFSFEGEAFAAYATEAEDSIPIYRLFNTTTGAHFYTPSEAERDNAIANLPGFESEGIAYYALASEL